MRVQTNDEEFLDAFQEKLQAMFVSFPFKRFSLGVFLSLRFIANNSVESKNICSRCKTND